MNLFSACVVQAENKFLQPPTLSSYKLHVIAVGLVVVLILLLIILFGFKHIVKSSRAYKWLMSYLVIALSCEVAAIFCFYNSIPNTWIINLYTILEYTFIALLMNQLIKYKDRDSKLLKTLLVLGLAGYAIYFIFFKSFFSFSALTETIENVMLMGLCVYYFMFALGNEPNCKPEERKLMDTFSISLFVYLSGIVLLWLVNEFVAFDQFDNVTKSIVYANAYLNLAFKVAVLIAFLMFDHKVRRNRILGVSN